MSKWIRKGDKVVVTSGNDKGKTGEVILRKEDRVVVQGVNIRKKHVKRQQKTPSPRLGTAAPREAALSKVVCGGFSRNRGGMVRNRS